MKTQELKNAIENIFEKSITILQVMSNETLHKDIFIIVECETGDNKTKHLINLGRFISISQYLANRCDMNITFVADKIKVTLNDYVNKDACLNIYYVD